MQADETISGPALGSEPQAQFEQLVREHEEMVFRVLRRLLGAPYEGIDDLAQEVFLRLYRGLAGFRGEARVATYLYRITANVAHDALKRRGTARRREVSLSDEDAGLENQLAHDGPSAEEQLSEREFRATLELALRELKPVERTVLVLFHQEELSYEAVAAALGIPINTVRTHLHRGRGKLRERLGAFRGGVR